MSPKDIFTKEDVKETRQGVTRYSVYRHQGITMYYVDGELVDVSDDEFQDRGFLGKVWFWMKRGW